MNETPPMAPEAPGAPPRTLLKSPAALAAAKTQRRWPADDKPRRQSENPSFDALRGALAGV